MTSRCSPGTGTCPPEYAPQEVAVFEALRGATEGHGPQDLGASRLVVAVADVFVPMRKPYVDLLRERGFTVTPVATSTFCRDRDEVVRAAAKTGCDAFLLAYPLTVCSPQASQDLVVVMRYDHPCAAK